MENSSHLSQKQCPLTLDEAMEYEMKHGCLLNNPNADLKKIRRNLSNKLSAQRSRNKMVNRTRELEDKVKDIEASVSILIPQLESCKEKKRLLQLENVSLCRELEKRSNEYRRREMEIEEKRAKIKVQKEAMKTAQKNQHKASSSAPDSASEPSGKELKPANEVVKAYQLELIKLEKLSCYSCN